MGRQEDPARPVVTSGDVLAVLDLAEAHLDTATPVPASWDAVIAQIRAVLLARAAAPVSGGAAPPAPVPEDSAGQRENTSGSRHI